MLRALRATLPTLVVLAVWGALRVATSGWIDRVWVGAIVPATAGPLVALQNAVGVSLSLLGIALACAPFAVAAIAPGRRARLPWLIAAALALGPAFEATFGLGYRRSPLEVVLGLPDEAVGEEEAWRVWDAVERILIEAAPSATGLGVGAAPWSAAIAAGGACVARLDAAIARRAAPLPTPTRVRTLPAGTLLQAGFAGIAGPWWREPHVDGGLPPAAATSTALHEIAHTLGWAREAETDAVATLAGLACDDAQVRFAAAAHALALLANEIVAGGGDDERVRSAVRARLDALPDAYHEARAAARAAAEAHRRPVVAQATAATYATYLRGQGVTLGLADYGRAGALILAVQARCLAGEPCPTLWIPPGGMMGGERPTSADAARR